jgi:transcriptional regulator with XRE-family HTH domain
MGERIKDCRSKIGMTQQELADAVGISRNSMSRIETSAVPNMTVYTAMRIAHALGITMDFLVYGNC